MTQPLADLIADLLRKNFAGAPWHGPGVLELLRDLDAARAAAHPVAGAHSVWELVLHMTAWHNEVRRRLEGAPPAMPLEGDWPAVPEPTEEARRRAVENLASSLEELCTAIRALPESRLYQPIGTLDRPLGTGVTLAEMLIGLLQHDTYHGGQIALLCKTLGSPSPG